MDDKQMRDAMHSPDPAAKMIWRNICDDHEKLKQKAVQDLRALGVKLAHPDDGWVKRELDGSGEVSPAYPLFDDGPKVGDLIALGHPDAATKIMVGIDSVPYAFTGYRLVKVTETGFRAGYVLPQYPFYKFEMVYKFWPPLEEGSIYRKKINGDWEPAEPLGFIGWKANLEFKLRNMGLTRLANFFGRWDERGLGK